MERHANVTTARRAITTDTSTSTSHQKSTVESMPHGPHRQSPGNLRLHSFTMAKLFLALEGLGDGLEKVASGLGDGLQKVRQFPSSHP